MPERTVKIPNDVRDLIRHLPPNLKRKIRAGLSEILEKPACGKPLKRELAGYWSLRIGQHRVIYRPDDFGAEIVAVGPRKTIYDEIARSAIRNALAPGAEKPKKKSTFSRVRGRRYLNEITWPSA
jgi:mRNA-degrading endonuclease RelE of RelBE toxin-antitoxin system